MKVLSWDWGGNVQVSIEFTYMVLDHLLFLSGLYAEHNNERQLSDFLQLIWTRNNKFKALSEL